MNEGSNTVNIEITSRIPGIGTADMRYWRHTIELDRALIGSDFTVVRRPRRLQEIWPTSQGFSTNTASRASQHPSLVRINSVDELLYYYESNRDFMPQEMLALLRNSRYNAGFFRNSSLVLLRLEEPCGSYILELVSVCAPAFDSVVDVEIRRTPSPDNTGGRRFWYFAFTESNWGTNRDIAVVIRDELPPAPRPEAPALPYNLDSNRHGQ